MAAILENINAGKRKVKKANKAAKADSPKKSKDKKRKRDKGNQDKEGGCSSSPLVGQTTLDNVVQVIPPAIVDVAASDSPAVGDSSSHREKRSKSTPPPNVDKAVENAPSVGALPPKEGLLNPWAADFKAVDVTKS